MVSNIRIVLNKELIDAESIMNLHRFGNSITKAFEANYQPTRAQVMVSAMLTQSPIFEIYPAYPLSPDGTIEQMLAGKLDEATDNSYDFIISFHSTCDKEQKDALMMELLASEYIESVRDVRI